MKPDAFGFKPSLLLPISSIKSISTFSMKPHTSDFKPFLTFSYQLLNSIFAIKTRKNLYET